VEINKLLSILLVSILIVLPIQVYRLRKPIRKHKKTLFIVTTLLILGLGSVCMLKITIPIKQACPILFDSDYDRSRRSGISLPLFTSPPTSKECVFFLRGLISL
jgi:hypothetical protein